MSIIISKKGAGAKKLDKASFESEDYLQNYIHENPEAIPVYEIQEDKKLFVIAREFDTESGPIDALSIDKDGDIYIVETKLYKNSDKRTVVAQALDYGASLWKHFNDFNEFKNILEEEIQRKFGVSFDEKVKEFFNLDDEQAGLLLENMKSNLREGNIKFVILMDSMDDRLKDLILYVNQNSQFDIYAVQLEYYQFEKYEIMIPKIFGVEVKKNVGSLSKGTRKKWNEEDFLKQSQEVLKEESSRVEDLLNYFKTKADKINWGTGNTRGTYSPIFNHIHKTISPFSLYADGEVLIKLNWLRYSIKKEKLEKYTLTFSEELEKKTGIKIPQSQLMLREAKITAKDFLKYHKEIKIVMIEMLGMK